MPLDPSEIQTGDVADPVGMVEMIAVIAFADSPSVTLSL